MSQSALAQHLSVSINWQRFVNLVVSLGNQLNDSQWRFFKAVVFENSMETYSNGSVRYVGETGCDLLVTHDGITHRVEMKYDENALYTPAGDRPRAFSKSITLVNSKGTNTHTQLPAHYADYVLIVGRRGAALIDKTTLSKYCTYKGDSITAVVPTNLMSFVFTPYRIDHINCQPLNLRQELERAVRSAIATIQ